MALNPTVAQHLVEARRELADQRDALSRDIKMLDEMLEGYVGTPSGGVAHNVAVTDVVGTTDRADIGVAPPMREAIVSLLKAEGRPLRTDEVVATLGREYGWTRASVRSLLAKMGKRGDIGRPRRGYYHHDPTMTYSPDVPVPVAMESTESPISLDEQAGGFSETPQPSPAEREPPSSVGSAVGASREAHEA